MDWTQLASEVDAIVDEYFSEPVELHPWLGAHSALVSETGPDPSRKVIFTEGIYVCPGARATGEAGTVAAGLATRVVSSDEWLSITLENLGGDPSVWLEGDRVFWPLCKAGQDPWHTISFVTPSATNRFNINLIRLKLGSPS